MNAMTDQRIVRSLIAASLLLFASACGDVLGPDASSYDYNDQNQPAANQPADDQKTPPAMNQPGPDDGQDDNASGTDDGTRSKEKVAA